MNSQSDDKRAFARSVVDRLRARGFVALWAGGCVRDMLLGCVPKDYDVATDAEPEQVRDVFGHRRTLAIGAAFGVIVVQGSRESGNVEVATFRQDHGYSDGRRPDGVSFSSPEEDAQRRDFTINGMFYDPVADRTIDYVSGIADLKAGVVRAIGDPDQRFAEDKLRLLRAVRFATTLEFHLESQTADSIVRHADEITVVSGERMAMELERMLCHSRRAEALQMLGNMGLLGRVLPELHQVESDLDIELPRCSGAWKTKLALLDSLVEPTWAMILAALFHHHQVDRIGAASDQLRKACRRLRLSNAITDRSVWLLRNERVVRQARQVGWPEVQPLLIDSGCDELLRLAGAVAELEGDREDVAFCCEKRALPENQLNPVSLITGDDLLELGVNRGPRFGKLLKQIRVAQLEQRIETREQALALLDQMQREPPDVG